MSKEFFIGDSRYIINEDNNDFKIYPADKNGYPKQNYDIPCRSIISVIRKKTCAGKHKNSGKKFD